MIIGMIIVYIYICTVTDSINTIYCDSPVSDSIKATDRCYYSFEIVVVVVIVIVVLVLLLRQLLVVLCVCVY